MNSPSSTDTVPPAGRLGTFAGVFTPSILTILGIILFLRLGYVVDFIDVHARGWHWPAFNVADSAITCGVILLLLDSLLQTIAEKRASAE